MYKWKDIIASSVFMELIGLQDYYLSLVCYKKEKSLLSVISINGLCISHTKMSIPIDDNFDRMQT